MKEDWISVTEKLPAKKDVGRWKYTPPKQNVGYWYHTGRHKTLFDPPEECLECSVCGFQMDYDEPPAVCPNCHSMMKWGGYKQ